MLQSVLLAAISKLADHLSKEMRELGSHTNDLEDKMDATVTVIKNHEQDLSDIKKKELTYFYFNLTIFTGPWDRKGPRDIIIKFTYYCTKETLLVAARNRFNLSFQGHHYQLFLDLSQITFQKRRQLKAFTSVLVNQHIKYTWGFPFVSLLNIKAATTPSLPQ